MVERILQNIRILVVEDEYLLADEIRSELEDAGALVVGPVATLNDALGAIDGEPHIDAVVLDLNLRGVMAYPAADLLLERQIPFAFTTGYDETVIPSRFAHVPLCQKPVHPAKVVRAIGRAIDC